ncbi:MAG: YbjN domain-containing protein [Alteripontixanthobacter sp.]
MLKPALAACVTAATLAVSPPAFAENIVADHSQVQSALQSAGYRAQLEGEGDERFISSGSSGYNFAVFFYGCDDAGHECKSVQFYAAFTPTKKPTLAQMNEYASSHRWGRIYIDKDGDPVIEMDIDLEDGGMSPELFQDNIEYWASILDSYAEWVFDQDDG